MPSSTPTATSLNDSQVSSPLPQSSAPTAISSDDSQASSPLPQIPSLLSTLARTNGNHAITILVYLEVSASAASPIFSVLIEPFLQDNKAAKQMPAETDDCGILRLSKFKIALGKIGLELGISGVEIYRKGKWMKIRSDTALPVEDVIIVLRVTGVTAMLGWEVDSKFYR